MRLTKYAQLRRLIQLHNLLLDVAEENFDQGTWGHRSGKQSLSCGTTACVGGWATAIVPELQLKITPGDSDADLYNRLTKSKHVGAFADAFQLSDRQAYRLTAVNSPWQTAAGAAKAVLKMAQLQAQGTDYEFPEIRS